MITADSLRDLLKYGERLTLECKKAENHVPNSVWETYSAFANTVGGTILFGVEEHQKEKDPGKRFTIANIENPQARMKEFWDTIHNTNKVNISILRDVDVGTCVVDGKTIIWIEVPQADYTRCESGAFLFRRVSAETVGESAASGEGEGTAAAVSGGDPADIAAKGRGHVPALYPDGWHPLAAEAIRP